MEADVNVKHLWDQLHAVELEMQSEFWEMEEREFLMQRASHYTQRINAFYKKDVKK